jgi:nicotinate-nucleotide adenylyltransferase
LQPKLSICPAAILYDKNMDFFRRAPGTPAKLGILSATFNPPTRAHIALARAGLQVADEVVFVLPHSFPHKSYEAVGFSERLQMIEAALGDEPHFSIAAARGGLFIDIAHECRSDYGPEVELKFLCGRDAAERIVNWDYGKPGAFREMLQEFELYVAPREGNYEPPPGMRDRIHPLSMPPGYNHISSTQVRNKAASGEDWEHLVPEAIVPLVRKYYSRPKG